MRFEFVADQACQVKTLLRHHDISRGLLAKIKFRGGGIWVNGRAENAVFNLTPGDVVTIAIPDEEGYDKLEPVAHDLNIIYEDEHFLAIDKPVGFASIPSSIHSNTMANFVKHYVVNQGYPNHQIHIVTRLDRDTSGVMLFAKHGYAHARLDKQLQTKTIQKRYYALVAGEAALPKEGEIIAPIARDVDSIITRRVHESGKFAHTSYKLIEEQGKVKLVDIQLHTGRTHQIRVHFAHIGQPLLGDDLYGGDMTYGIQRQALHCHSLTFFHPFLGQELQLTAPLTNDMASVMMRR